MGLFSLANAYIYTDCPRELHLRYKEKHKSIALRCAMFSPVIAHPDKTKLV